jgi:hypothetical protein
MIFIHGGIYNICRSVAPQFIKIRSYTNVSYAYVDAYHWRSLNDRFSRLTSHSLETGVCLLGVESRSLAYDCMALIFFGYFTLLASIEKNGMFSRSWGDLMRSCFELKKESLPIQSSTFQLKLFYQPSKH